LLKVKMWLEVSSKLKAVNGKDIGIFVSLRSLIVISILVSLLNLASCTKRFIFFPDSFTSNVVMEFFLVVVLLFLSGLRNWSARRGQVDLAVRIRVFIEDKHGIV
jgi:hypothetical protein